MRSEDAREGAAARDLDDLRQAGSPSGHESVECEPLGALVVWSRELCFELLEEGFLPLQMIGCRQRICAEALGPRWTDQIVEKFRSLNGAGC